MRRRAIDLQGRYEATLQHVSLIHRKLDHLDQARMRAEEQLFYSIRRDHAAGELSDDDLAILRVALDQKLTRPFGRQWDAQVPLRSGAAYSRHRYLHKFLPNGPSERSWVGTRRDGDESAVSRPGVAVVYVLYGTDNEPIYLGSSGNLRQRLSAHQNGPLPWVAYLAVECRDRDHAYELEDFLLKTRTPPLNRRAGR